MAAAPVAHHPSSTVPEAQTGLARITYRYLRWLMIVLPLVLLAVTVLTAVQQRRLESSISAYYAGPVRDVFVGVMVAAAACMVAYQGASLLEDYTLNGAGFYAVFVALVPSSLERILTELRTTPTPDRFTATDYVWFLRFALSVVLVLCAVLLVVELRTRRATRLWESHGLNRLFVVFSGAVLAAFLALAMVQLWGHPAADVTMDGLPLPLLDKQLRIHDLAAILLIASLAVAVWSHAYPETVATRENLTAPDDTDRELSNRYRAIFSLMLAGPVVLIPVNAVLGHYVIFLEWWEILAFCLFWILETIRVNRLAV